MMDISNCTKSTGSLALCYAWMPWWVQRIPLHARSICRFKYFTMQIKINTTSMIVWNHWLATAEQSSSAVALFKHIIWLHCIIFGSVVSLFESNAYYMNLKVWCILFESVVCMSIYFNFHLIINLYLNIF